MPPKETLPQENKNTNDNLRRFGVHPEIKKIAIDAQLPDADTLEANLKHAGDIFVLPPEKIPNSHRGELLEGEDPHILSDIKISPEDNDIEDK